MSANPLSGAGPLLQRGLQWIAVISVLCLIGMNAPAQKVYNASQDTSDQYEMLFVAASDNGNTYGVHKTPETTSDGRVKQGSNAKKVVEWALSKARVTVLTEGKYVTGAKFGIDIDEDNASLIIGPDATVAGTGEKEYPLMVRVKMANNVNVLNLGTIDTGNEQSGPKGRGVQYMGNLGERGASGVKGGIILGAGQLVDVNAGYFVLDSENVRIPLLWSESHMNAVMTMEGAYDTDIGTIAQLALGKGAGEGETIDLNMSCRNVHMNHVIGLAPNPGDEVLDINNSAHVTVDRLSVFQGTGYDGALLVGYDLYGHSGMSSKRPKIQRQKAHNIKWTERIRKDVAEFKRKIRLPNYPQSLPTLNVHARLIVEFEDGSTWEMVNKKYRFNL